MLRKILGLSALVMEQLPSEGGAPAAGGGAATEPAKDAGKDPAAKTEKAASATPAKPTANGKGATAPAKPAEQTETEKKKEAAAKAARSAAEATRKAEAAAAEATQKQQEASALAAEAEGKVVVSSPRRFGIHIPGTGTVFIEKGVSNVAREIAEHDYAKAHGVKLLGLPFK